MKYKTMLELIDMIADRPLKIKVYDIYAKYKPEMMISQGLAAQSPGVGWWIH